MFGEKSTEVGVRFLRALGLLNRWGTPKKWGRLFRVVLVKKQKNYPLKPEKGDVKKTRKERVRLFDPPEKNPFKALPHKGLGRGGPNFWGNPKVDQWGKLEGDWGAKPEHREKIYHKGGGILRENRGKGFLEMEKRPRGFPSFPGAEMACEKRPGKGKGAPRADDVKRARRKDSTMHTTIIIHRDVRRLVILIPAEDQEEFPILKKDHKR
ncbi:unnamed protein product [Coregonus sp. 'balchen']|nr:unnamed protein product [Coregonus sp. 'balchen']